MPDTVLATSTWFLPPGPKQTCIQFLVLSPSSEVKKKSRCHLGFSPEMGNLTMHITSYPLIRLQNRIEAAQETLVSEKYYLQLLTNLLF